MSLYRRVLNVFRPGKLNRDVDDELAFHHEMRLRRAVQQGLDEVEAERETRLRLGNLTLVREEMREARTVSWLASSVQDLRHGVVLLHRDAALSALIIAVLGLGIGGTAAIFTLFKAAFLDALPYRDSGRLITVVDRFGKLGIDGVNPTIPEFLDIRERSRGSIEEMAFLDHRDLQVTGSGEPARVFGARVTAGFFPLLGVNAAMGRTFAEEENRPGKTHVVVLTDGFWRTRLGADPNMVGKNLMLSGQPHVVIGVLPREFRFDYPTLGVPEPAEVYVPYELSDYYTKRSGGYSSVRRVRALARIRAAATPGQVAADLEHAGAYLASTYPALYRGPKGEATGFSVRSQPLRDAIVGRQRPLVWLLFGSAGALLLIACANTVHLLLARGLRRGREVAIRTALGASRTRLIRQFLLEGAVLAACGGACGLVLAGWLVRGLVMLLPVRHTIFDSARPDMLVTGFTMALSLISAVACAIVPAIKGSAWTPGPALMVRNTIAQGNRWRHAMIAVEAGLSVFLLCGAALVAQNLWSLMTSAKGFDARDVTVMQIRLPWHREQALNPTPMLAYRDYLERISGIPGVVSAATVSGLPLRGAGQTNFLIDRTPGESTATPRQTALLQVISPDYFRTLRIPLLAGRTFGEHDRTTRPAVAIVNQEFVRRFDLRGDPLGRQIRMPNPTTIIGVVGDVRMSPVAITPEPQIYVSYLQSYEPNVYVVVRSSIDRAQLAQRVKEAIYAVYPDQSVFNVSGMDAVISRSVAEPRFQAFLIGAFALLALAMSASGMYSVVSCLVSQRTSEIAIRMALGAGFPAVVQTVLGATVAWVAAGLGCGLGLALAARSTVRSLAFTVVSGSPWLYGAVVAIFFVVTVGAAYRPVRRAGRLDPSAALRCE